LFHGMAPKAGAIVAAHHPLVAVYPDAAAPDFDRDAVRRIRVERGHEVVGVPPQLHSDTVPGGAATVERHAYGVKVGDLDHYMRDALPAIYQGDHMIPPVLAVHECNRQMAPAMFEGDVVAHAEAQAFLIETLAFRPVCRTQHDMAKA